MADSPYDPDVQRILDILDQLPRRYTSAFEAIVSQMLEDIMAGRDEPVDVDALRQQLEAVLALYESVDEPTP